MRLAVAVTSIVLVAGNPTPSGAASGNDAPAPPVIRISVEMIQVDAVVTDKKGHHVTDLQPGDVEIRQDGRLQTISRLSYVQFGAPTASVARAAAGPGAAAAGQPAAEAEARPRTIVFVVDDLSLSPHSFDRARRALKLAVEGLDPADRVAIVTTAHGFLGLTPTTDRKANLDAVAALRRSPWTRTELMPLLATESTFFHQGGMERFEGGSSDDWNARLVLQSIAIVKQTVNSLQPLPGRKALLLISEGFAGISSFDGTQVHDIYWPLDRLYGDSDDLIGAWKRLGDFAARAAVVIHAIDPRGLMTAGMTAQESGPATNTPEAVNEAALSRKLYLYQSQGSLQHLTDETGGLAMLDQNDMSGAVSSILADLSGYYLIGYEPAQGTFTGGGFHDIAVKVKRPGLKVRTRKGFYAVTDAQVAAALPQR